MVISAVQNMLPVNVSNFVCMQLKHVNMKKMPWTEEEKLQALAMRYKSPALYDQMRSDGFALPSPSTIARWLQTVDLRPGVCSEIMQMIENKVKHMNNWEKHAVIIFDEMSIKSSLDYDSKRDLIEEMSSDNLVARREARRRKILENSEIRLKRIAGRSDTTEKTDNLQPEDNGFVSISNDIISNGTVKSQKETTSSIPSREWSEDDTYVESSISEQFDFLSSTSGVVENDPTSSFKSVASYVPSNLIYISVAILFRFSIELDSHFLYVNSLVVAFLVTKLAVCSIYGLPIPETSRFLGSLLLLSGISTQKIKILTLTMSIVYSGLHEFALCIFIFVFCDLFVNLYKSISHQ